MSQRNIAAWTAVQSDPFPPYISINEQPDKRIVVTARPSGDIFGDKTISFEIPYRELVNFASTILERIDATV